MATDPATAREALADYVLELAGGHEVTAHDLRAEHGRHDVGRAAEFDDRRFGLEQLAAVVRSRPDDYPPLRTLLEHHEHCGGGRTYRPGHRVQAALDGVRAQRDEHAGLRAWVQAAWLEMGRPLDDEEDS